MQKLVLLAVLLLATTSVATAQKKGKKEKELVVEFGKVPQEDMAMTVYPLDSSAEAVVLAAKGRLAIEQSNDGGWQLNYQFFRRVKLLKKSAFATEGDIKISYYSKDRFEDLRRIKAAVIQPDGTRQELTKKEFFEEKSTKNYTTKKFAFPNLKEGSIIEYEYELISQNLRTLKDWQFQENIPVRHSELWLSIPQYYDYVYLFRGRHPLKKGEVMEDNTASNVKLAIQKLSADSVPALKPEGDYITTMGDYVSQINLQLSRVNQPDGRIENIMTNWKDVAEKLTKNEYMGEQMRKKSNYGDVWRAVKPLVETAKTDDEKIKIIYDYLCKNVNWDDDNYSEYSYEESLNDAFKKKKANSGQLNMMLIACLSEANVKAYPMLVSTRRHGRPITIYPIMDQFNHLVCYIEREGKPSVIDVGNIHRPVGLPRVSTLNGQGWILDKDNPRWVNIAAPLSNEVALASFKLNDEGTLTGSISSNYRGYAAVNERGNDEDGKHEKTKKALAKDFPDIKIDSITTANLDNTAEPFKRTVYCAIPNAATTAGDLIYIRPSLKTDFDENPFKQPKREYPVEFPYPFKDQFVLNLTIPDGYAVDEMPKSMKANLPDNGGSFQYLSSVTGNVIQLIVKIQLDRLRFEPEDYDIVKDFFGQIATKSAEQIVLKKKAN